MTGAAPNGLYPTHLLDPYHLLPPFSLGMQVTGIKPDTMGSPVPDQVLQCQPHGLHKLGCSFLSLPTMTQVQAHPAAPFSACTAIFLARYPVLLLLA